MNFLMKTIVICGLVIWLAIPSFAAEGKSAGKSEKSVKAEANNLRMASKTLRGVVSARGPNGIALEFEKNEQEKAAREYWFPYEPGMKLGRYKSAEDIQEGDTVTVSYEESEDRSRRVLKMIELERRKPKEPKEVEEPIEGE